jgi:hypothetical protein
LIADQDIVFARFIELQGEERIVEAVAFEGVDPTSAVTMTLTVTMKPVTGGTKVTFLAEHVPEGGREKGCVADMESVLKKLSNLLE